MSTTELVVQVIGVSVTAVGVIAALAIAVGGNRAADRRAAADRDEARRLAQHQHDVDMLVTLAQNLQRGGSLDPEERKRMGTEALTLISALGAERLPRSYAMYVKYSLDEMEALADDSSLQEWKRCANEVVWELQRTVTLRRFNELPEPGDTAPGTARTSDGARSAG